MLLLLGLFASPAFGQHAGTPLEPDGIVAVLVEGGFENVAVEKETGRITVWYENRVHRYELVGIGDVVSRVAPGLDGETVLELIPQNRRVPLLSLSAPAGAWVRFLDGQTDADTFRSQLAIGMGSRLGGLALAPNRPLTNPSTWRTDLALRPLFSFDLGRPNDAFLYRASLAPEATLVPFPGGLVTLQGDVVLHTDFSCGIEDPCETDLTPGRNTLSWGGWLPGTWLLALSGGYFPEQRWGFAGEVGRLFWDGQIEVRGGGNATGLLEITSTRTRYSNLTQWAAFAAGTYRPRGVDLNTTLTVGRFREEAMAVRVDVARRFHEYEVGFFGVLGEEDDLVGMTLLVPLPVRRYSRPRPVRFTTVAEFPFTYRESITAVGLTISQFDNLDRLRKRLYPTFIRNNLEDMRWVRPDIPYGGGS